MQYYYCMKTIHLLILLFLLDNNTSHTILAISKAIDKNYSNTYQAVQEMEELTIRKIGNSSLVSLNSTLTPDLYHVEIARRKQYMKSQDLRNIAAKLDKISSPFFSVLLFGSRLTSTNPNDIDLCIIADRPELQNQIRNELDTLSYPLDINTFTSAEFMEMLLSKQPNLANEIIKHNIILKGIENYYWLLQWIPSEHLKMKGLSQKLIKKK